MRHLPSSIMLAAWLSLLAAQSSGLHMHVNAHGYVGTPQGVHVHGQNRHIHEGDVHEDHAHATSADGEHEHAGELEHQGDKDVSSVEISGASKSLVFLAWLGFGLLIILGVGEKISPHSALPRLSQRHTHLRPPLRAPPHLSLSPSH